MIRVIVKGTKKNATRAASRRHIPLKNCHTGRTKGLMYCDAPCSKYKAIAAWYGEKPSLRAGRGYQPGALVMFNPGTCR